MARPRDDDCKSLTRRKEASSNIEHNSKVIKIVFSCGNAGIMDLGGGSRTFRVNVSM